MIFNNLSDILNCLPTGTLTIHRQTSVKRPTVFNNYKQSAWMNFCKLPIRENSATQTFVNTKILFLSILPIN